MIVAILVFLCGITQIVARPNNGADMNTVENLEQIPSSWPQLKNTYLLPKKLNVDDIINVTAVIMNTPMLTISLIAESSVSANSSKVLCTLIADTSTPTGLVTILDDNGINKDEEQLSSFLTDDETIFNVWFRRRSSVSTQNNNILEIRSNSFHTLLPLPEVNDIRFLKFSGENVKVTELEFKYANH